MTKDLGTTNNISKLYKEISSILHTVRANAYKTVNFAMVTSYWSVGQVIVENETARNWYMNEAANQTWYSWRCRLNSSDASDELTPIISNFKLSD